MQKQNVEIRPLTRLEELAQVEALQRVAWDDPTAVVYRNTLLTISRNGGLVLGAVDRDKIVGIVFSYLGNGSPEAQRSAKANFKLVSPPQLVLPGLRDAGNS